jgi:hypothetical protein
VEKVQNPSFSRKPIRGMEPLLRIGISLFLEIDEASIAQGVTGSNPQKQESV